MFEYSVKFENGTELQKQKVLSALAEAHDMMRTDKFKEAVLAYRDFYQTDKTSVEIYEILKSGKWEYSVRFYSKPISSANAYVDLGDPTVNLNWYKISGWANSAIANTLVHEHTHLFGFDHDYKPTPKRPQTVPYAIGNILESLLNPNKVEGRYYTPWYRRIWRWFR